MSRSTTFRRLRELMGRARARRGLARRELLTGAAAALGVAACRGADEPLAEVPQRVAIVGAGIAGLHCAYRLQEAGFPQVVVYEARDRVGGRMWTGRDLFADGQVCELGGELIDSNHASLWSLAEELGIALDDRWAGEPAGFVRDTWEVDGATVTDEQLLEQLVATVDAFDAAVVAADTDDDAFTTLDATTLHDWLVANVPPATYPELHGVLQSAYRGEFGLENDQQSALNLIYLMGTDTESFLIFGDSDERWHTHLGNDTFTTALADALAPGTVALESRLVAVEQTDTGYRLTLSWPDGTQFTDDVGHVVFALPFSVLREVDLSVSGLSAAKREVIDTLGYGTNAKVMAGFTRPVWKEDHNASGSVTTDRPMQQSWDTSVGQSGASAILTNFLGGEQGLASAAGTPDGWVRDVLLPDLDALFPGAAAAYTGVAVRLHWPTVDTHKGSYTCYRPGQWVFWGTEGAREGTAHFCGEHCSLDFQGWMEGAAETGALVAAEILDDHGLPTGRRHRALLELKRVVPQACYHRGQPARGSLWERRRRLAEVWRGRR